MQMFIHLELKSSPALVYLMELIKFFNIIFVLMEKNCSPPSTVGSSGSSYRELLSVILTGCVAR